MYYTPLWNTQANVSIIISWRQCYDVRVCTTQVGLVQYTTLQEKIHQPVDIFDVTTVGCRRERGREGGREGDLLPCPCLPAVLRFDYDCASLSRHMYIHRDHFPLSTHCTFQRQLVNSTHATIKNIMSMTHVLLYTDSLNKLKSYSIYFCKIYNHTCRSVH